MKKDLTGKRFGRLTVLKEAGRSKDRQIIWECICDCGNTTLVKAGNLTSGDTKSCGCLHKEKFTNFKHGQRHTKLYGVWCGIKARCQNPNSTSYKDYGGRGIKICEEWEDFTNFYSWAIANGYKNGLTIERKDNNKNYSPSNCKWATYKEQANNKRNNVYFTYQGETKTLAQWDESTDKDIAGRISKGWTIEQAMNTENNYNHTKIELEGKFYTIAELAKKYKINYGTLYNRIKKLHWPIEKAINKKPEDE